MRKTIFFVVAFLLSSQLYSQTTYLQQWPTFRGPFAKGYIEGAKTVSKWDVETDENILWQTKIPGLGHSCPVIWDNKMFITTAISGSGTDELKVGLYGDIDAVEDESEHEFKLFCLDKNAGDILWEKLVYKGVPAVKRHTKASHADCTPATDGKHLVVFFGSQGLFCFDLEGKELWKKDFGKMNAGPYSSPDFEWGFSSSPIIHNGKVIIQCDFIGDGFIASLDVKTGDEVWRSPRDEVSTWCSPTIYENKGQTQIAVNGWKHMGGYNFNTGEEIWKMSGGGDAPTPTPVIANDLIFINNAHGRYAPIYAVTKDAKGDITLGEKETSNEHIVWSVKRGGAYMQTPLIYGDYLYNLRGNGSLSVFKATSGELMYKESFGSVGGFTASGIAANNLVYFSSERGDVFVVKAGPEYELVSQNSMNDILMASPAISGDVLYFRAQKSVIAVGNK